MTAWHKKHFAEDVRYVNEVLNSASEKLVVSPPFFFSWPKKFIAADYSFSGFQIGVTLVEKGYLKTTNSVYVSEPARISMTRLDVLMNEKQVCME